MPKRHILDADKPLSQSLLWQIQRAYFLQAGMKAWQEDVVPSAISSNPVMARTYSQILFGYLRDCFAAAERGEYELDPRQPINIIELGAGSGRLAYHFLHTFLPHYRQSPFANQPVRYIMTDFVPQIIDFWREHGRFQPYFDAGFLDCAFFDVMDRERPFHLLHSKQTVTPDMVTNPLILIANYFFDSIPQDSFVVEDGLLCQNLLTLTSSQAEPDLTDPAIWERLTLHYEPIPLEKLCYKEPLYNQILDDYEAALPDANFSFPNVGLDCLNFWHRFGNGRLLLLTSDRGYTLLDTLSHQPDPLPNLHGSFSLMVNYHAVGEFVSRSGGTVCQLTHYQNSIQLSAYLLGQPAEQVPETRLAFAQAAEEGGPNDYFELKNVLEARLTKVTVSELLSYLRYSAWDMAALTACLPRLEQCLKEEPIWREDIAHALRICWQRFLPLSAAEETRIKEKINHLLAVADQSL